MGWDLPIPDPSRIYKWDEKTSQSRPYIFFGTKICPNPVPKEMRFCRISSQLVKFSFLIGNETGWNEICQSHSRPAYVIGIKKCFNPVPNFFMGQKYVPIPSQMGWDPAGSHPIGKNCHPYILTLLISYCRRYSLVFRKIVLYLMGNGCGDGNHLSLVLALVDCTVEAVKVYVFIANLRSSGGKI